MADGGKDRFAGMTPVLKCSICTGERAAGCDDDVGKFHEVMLIRSGRDLDKFKQKYGVCVLQTRY